MAKRRRVTRLRGAARVVAVNLLLLGAVAVAAEFVFGGWLSDNSLSKLDIGVSERYLLDTSALYPGGGRVVYVTDRYGMRGAPGDPARIDLLVMGGSTTNEREITEGSTWADVMEAELRSSGHPLEVANIGVAGQSSYGHIVMLDRWFAKVPGLAPRYVLVYVGINDLAITRPTGFDSMRPKTAYQRLRLALFNNSALYDLYRRLRGIYRAWNAKVVYFSGDRVAGPGAYQSHPWRPLHKIPDRAAVEAEIRPLLDAYAQRITVLAQRIRDIGAEPIFVSQSRGDYLHHGDGLVYKRFNDRNEEVTGRFYVMQNLYGDVLMETCERLGAICIPLHRELRFRDGDFFDRVHTTPRGSRRIGEYLAHRLASYLAR